LLGVHSRYSLHTRAVTVFRDTLSEGFSHFVTSMTAPVASGWSVRRVGFAIVHATQFGIVEVTPALRHNSEMATHAFSTG